MSDFNITVPESNSTDSGNSTAPEGAEEDLGDSVVLRNTFSVYGPILLGVFLLFCYLRRKYKKPYQIRNWVTKHKTSIAENQHGFLSWMWQLNSVTEDEILNECGMDALCFLRLLQMGYRISCVAMFNAFWLMPVYALSPNHKSTSHVTDSVAKLTTGNVPEGSTRLVATVIAAYILFGYIMRLILKEFNWFIEMRHKYLKKTLPQNYTVHVRNIPSEYCTNESLARYFRHSISQSAVKEVRLRIKANDLQEKTDAREGIVEKLGDALTYEEIKNETPMHRDLQLTSVKAPKVRSIPAYSKQLKELNEEITQRIETIEDNLERPTSSTDLESQSESLISGSVRGGWGSRHKGDEGSVISEIPFDGSSTIHEEQAAPQSPPLQPVDEDGHLEETNATKGVGAFTPTAFKAVAGATLGNTMDLAKSAKAMVKSGAEEGDYLNSGFVSFSSLKATNMALQMVHHSEPFSIEVLEAPHPDDIFWPNVGREHKDLELGNLFSLSATVATCLLWTIPMTFIGSLGEADKARDVKGLAAVIDTAPWLPQVLAVLAPLLVKLLNGMLPMILGWFSMSEGPVSESIVTSSLFLKLSSFMIVQTFFVSALGSTIIPRLQEMANKPGEIIEILGTELPSKSTYFIQIVFVGMVVSIAMEMLRVVPLVMAFVRHYLSPKLTEEQRQRTVMGIRPLADPKEFEHADMFSQIVLNFIVMLVYAVIAPLTSFIQALCFIFMHTCYRHQFVYIYPHAPDSGGKIWLNFIKVLMSCMMVALFTIVGLISLKKGTIAAPMMFPLLIITGLFNFYIRQEHFRVAEFLPSRDCMKVDNSRKNLELEFLDKAYLQDEMRDKVKLPEDMTDDKAREIGVYNQEEVRNESDPDMEYVPLKED